MDPPHAVDHRREVWGLEVVQVERSNLYRKMKGFGLLPARKAEASFGA